jgi:4-hydroxy-3-methylbut-2-enyl diphosphate reductase IspH
MCFDVSDAIAPAKGKDRTPPLTDLGELVHNETVLTGRPARGIRIETRVEDVTTPTVMITAWTSAPDWVVDGVEERIDRISRRSLASNEQP